MKALTLFQPWAVLVGIGAKRIETRSWGTKYRGRLAIHVSARIPPEYRHLCGWAAPRPFDTVLEGILWEKKPVIMRLYGQDTPGISYHELRENLHLGCVTAIVDLVDCIPIAEYFKVSEQERAFGNYTPGRWAWMFGEVHALPTPIPAKGMQRLWEWKEPCPLTTTV